MPHNVCMPNSGRIFPFVVACILAAAPFGYSQAGAAPAVQPETPRPRRPVPPTRDPHTPGYVKATELPDGAVPDPSKNGNFIIGPTHTPAPEAGRSESTARRNGRGVHDGLRGQQVLPGDRAQSRLPRDARSRESCAASRNRDASCSPMFARSPCMCRRVTCRELRLHLSWARMDPTDCSSRRWTD